MGRFRMTAESQTAQAAGAPVTTTFNGYFAAIMAGASANFKLRRLWIGVRAGASVPTSQQMTIAAFRQTVACAGTGTTTVVGLNMDPRGTASVITGLLVTTATTSGTTGPTIGANPLDKWSFNTQSGLDIPYEFLEEFICDQGTANGLALVNTGNALPASHLFTVSAEWDEVALRGSPHDLTEKGGDLVAVSETAVGPAGGAGA